MFNWLRRILKVPIYVGKGWFEGWSSWLPFYIIYCDKHKWVITYPQGHNEDLICTLCERERGIEYDIGN